MRRHISKTRRATRLKFCIRNASMAIMTHAKFHFNRLMLTLIFGIWASEIYDKETHFNLLLKFLIFFSTYLTTYTDIFSHIFKMVTPRALRHFLLFIALNCLTHATFIANVCQHNSTKRTFKNWMQYINTTHKLSSNRVLHRCD